MLKQTKYNLLFIFIFGPDLFIIFNHILKTIKNLNYEKRTHPLSSHYVFVPFVTM